MDSFIIDLQTKVVINNWQNTLLLNYTDHFNNNIYKYLKLTLAHKLLDRNSDELVISETQNKIQYVGLILSQSVHTLTYSYKHMLQDRNC